MSFFIGLLLTIGNTSNLFGVWEQPPQSYTDTLSNTAIASDANGNGVVIVVERTDIGNANVNVYNYISSTDTWLGPTLLQSGVLSGDEVDVDMDNSGRAIAIWANNNGTHEVRTALYDGSTWIAGSPSPLTIGTGFIASPKVSMNGPNSALAAWVDNFSVVRSSFLTGGVWSSPIPVGATTDRFVRIAYSSNGTAVAGYINTTATAANYIGGVWQTPVTLNAGAIFTPVEVGIDADGNALAAWTDDGTTNVLSRFFDGSSWQALVILGQDALLRAPALTMASTGTAVAAWSTGGSPSPGLSRVFNGATWGPVLQFAENVSFDPLRPDTVALASDDFGNAIVLYSAPSNPFPTALFSANLPIGGVWGNFQTVFSGSPRPFIGGLAASLSNSGYAFATWLNNSSESFFPFASVDPVTLPPASIEGTLCKTPLDRINIITFTPSPSPVVLFYDLSRNGQFIARISAEGPFIYFDSNRCKNGVDVYSLVAVGLNGLLSIPVTVTLP